MNDEVQYAGDKIPGARPYQEDEFAIYNVAEAGGETGLHMLFVLADGMGGHEGGAIASAIVVESFRQAYMRAQGSPAQRLEAALVKSNKALKQEKKSNSSLRSMGCTLVATSLTDEGLEWISVGDSPLWLYRNRELARLNEDHSMAAVFKEQAERGKMSMKEAKAHPNRNALRSAVMGEDISLVDQSKKPLILDGGDKVLIASDGLETLSEKQIVNILSAHAQDAPAELVAQLLGAIDAKKKKRQDNATALLIHPPGDAKRQPLLSVQKTPKGRKTNIINLIMGIAIGIALMVLWNISLGDVVKSWLQPAVEKKVKKPETKIKPKPKLQDDPKPVPKPRSKPKPDLETKSQLDPKPKPKKIPDATKPGPKQDKKPNQEDLKPVVPQKPSEIFEPWSPDEFEKRTTKKSSKKQNRSVPLERDRADPDESDLIDRPLENR